MKTKMDVHKEKMETAIYSIRSELEETIKHRVEDLWCVDQKTQDLGKELTERNQETHVDLQVVNTSLDARTMSLQATLADTKNDLHEEAPTMKAEIGINQERIETKIDSTRREFQIQLRKSRPGPSAEEEQEPAWAQGSHRSSTGRHDEPSSDASSRS
jgi:hypothetical protein